MVLRPQDFLEGTAQGIDITAGIGLAEAILLRGSVATGA